MKIIKQLLMFSALSAVFISCESDDSDPVIEAPGAFETGILISNEGPFNMGNGSITFINPLTNNTVANIFATTNPDVELGNIVQSMAFTDDDVYIVSNNSNKITVANRNTFESIATIETGLENPRYMSAYDGKGFVSNWGDTASDTDDYLAVIDLDSNSITTTIPVALGPERMLTNENILYVAHKGAFSTNNIVTVINMDTSTVIDTITVGDVVDSMQIVGDDLWVLCGGKTEFTGDETAGSLYQINITDGTLITDDYTFQLTEHPSDLVNDGTTLYYTLNGTIRSLNTETPNALPGTAVTSGFFYEIEAKDGKLYATDAADFNSNGSLTVFDAASGMEESSYEVGLIPGGIYFNE